MTHTTATDVVIVGAGLAGLTAATKLASSGLSVVVLEQSKEASYLCNSRYTGGLFHIAMDHMLGDPDVIKANLERATGGEADRRLVDALVDNAPRAVNWLKLSGVRFIRGGPDGLRANSLAPPGVRQTGLNWRWRAGDVMLRALGKTLLEAGGRIELGAQAQQLLMENGRCVGVRVEQSGSTADFTAQAVVIADGGFQANLELVKKYISPRPEALLQRNARSGNGSGLKMAEAVGAKLVGMNRFYGHLQYRDAIHDQRFWPYPVVDSLATAAIVINASGLRFCDEGSGGVYVTNEVAKLPDPLGCSIVFDQRIWEGPGTSWLLPANPYLITSGGRLISAETLDELAKALEVDPVTLKKTVEAYNCFIESGTMPRGMPPRTTSSYKPWPIVHPPFHAVKICAGITYTMGGINTDANARVLNQQNRPIAGLYAAGATTGGLEGGGMAGYSGGLSKSATFGFLAAEHVLSELKSAAIG